MSKRSPSRASAVIWTLVCTQVRPIKFCLSSREPGQVSAGSGALVGRRSPDVARSGLEQACVPSCNEQYLQRCISSHIWLVCISQSRYQSCCVFLLAPSGKLISEKAAAIVLRYVRQSWHYYGGALRMDGLDLAVCSARGIEQTQRYHVEVPSRQGRLAVLRKPR